MKLNKILKYTLRNTVKLKYKECSVYVVKGEEKNNMDQNAQKH